MKTNKKAIFGFAVAMIFSLAIMQGISTKNSKQDSSMQQISAACGYVAGSSEDTSTKVMAGSASLIWGSISSWCISSSVATGVITPAGLTCAAGAAVSGL